MGRRPRFCPPLLSNRCTRTVASHSSSPQANGEPCAASRASLARLSAIAARRREELLPEVEEEEASENVPPQTMGMLPQSSSSQGLCRANSSSPRIMQGLQFRSPLSRMLLSPRLRSPLDNSLESSLACVSAVVTRRREELAAEVEEEEAGNNVPPQTMGMLPPSSSSQGLCRTNSSSPRVMQGPQFRSPLSRMLLSPRLRSPLISTTQSRRTRIDLNRRKYIVTTSEQRRTIFDSLLAMSTNGQLKGHETTVVSAETSVPVRTIQRIWEEGKKCLDEGRPIDFSSRRKKRCGRKKKEVDVSALSSVPIGERTTEQDTAKHLGTSRSKLQRMKKAGEIKRVSNSLKPFLTDENKKDRLNWCLRMLDPTSVPHDPKFQGLFDYVHIDEKWFNITRNTLRYYCAPDEQQPTRTCKSKNFIPKIMILTAVARPRFDADGNCTFDGKIGCFPFITYVAAKRSSANRPAGTVEMKPIESIDKGVMRKFMIEKVLPAIHAKWPREDVGKVIYIQQDNAKPHISPSDSLFCEAAQQGL